MYKTACTNHHDIVIVLFHIVEEHPFVDSTVENASNRLKGTMPLIFRESEEGVQSIVTSADTMIVEGDTVAMILKQEYLSLADEING